jgi:hypothetical protein
MLKNQHQFKKYNSKLKINQTQKHQKKKIKNNRSKKMLYLQNQSSKNYQIINKIGRMKMEKSKANRKTVAQKLNQKKIVLHQQDKNK